MKRTDKEIIEAMTFIKEQHNGEMPYLFGTFECAKMMAKYLKKQLTIPVVSQQREMLKAYSDWHKKYRDSSYLDPYNVDNYLKSL